MRQPAGSLIGYTSRMRLRDWHIMVYLASPGLLTCASIRAAPSSSNKSRLASFNALFIPSAARTLRLRWDSDRHSSTVASSSQHGERKKMIKKHTNDVFKLSFLLL